MTTGALHQVLLAEAVGGPKVLAYQSNTSLGTDLTTYTFTALAIGTAVSDRRVIVGFSGGAGGAQLPQVLSSAAIGGVAATINVQGNAGAANGNIQVGFVTALVPTGTTADIALTFATGIARCDVDWWTATGLISNTAIGTATNSADPGSVTIVVFGGGFAVAKFGINNNPNTTAWTNATERSDATGADGESYGAADATTAFGSLNIQADYSLVDTRRMMAAASF